VLLLPAPRSATWLPGHAPVAAPVRVAVDTTLPAQGYHLEITPGEVLIAHADAAGLRHAQATLAQLPTRPCCRIEDAPTYATRGVMLDISRDRVPAMPELLTLIDTLAGWKINHLQLYIEHTFAYRDHRAAWDGWSPLTHDDITRLTAHAASRGIDLAANQNCLGHLERWFRLPQYAALAEIAPGQAWDFNGLVTKTGPFSLCPDDPGSLPFVTGLLDELLPLFPASMANIGCDEAFDLGQGRSRAAVAQRGRATVYLDWVRQVCAVVRRHGKTPQFWADIALEHPEALRTLPDDLVCLCWGYEGDAPFARWVQQVHEAGRRAWVCPGTSCWRTFTGRTAERHANLLAAATTACDGFLATAWGDLGHRQPWPVTLHALAEAAHRAWAGAAALDPRAIGRHAFGIEALGPWLDALGDADRDLRLTAKRRNASELFVDLHRPWSEPAPGGAGDYEAAADALDRLGESLPPVGGLVEQELRLGGRLARLAAERGFARRVAPHDRAARRILAEDLRQLMAEHRRLWSRRARPGGLDASCAHYQAIIDDLDAR
jgi:hypothetical protein